MSDKVKTAISKYESNYSYGQATIEPTENWNYSVFKKVETDLSGNSEVNNYELDVVRENYVDEDELNNIIMAILDNTPLKLKKTKIKYDYIYNKKNSMVSEVAIIYFYKSSKVCYG